MASFPHYDFEESGTTVPPLIINHPAPAQHIPNDQQWIFLVGPDKTRLSVPKSLLAFVSTLSVPNNEGPFVVKELTVDQFLVFLDWLKHGHVITSVDRRICEIVNQKFAIGPTSTTNYRPTLFAEPCLPSEPATLEDLYGVHDPEAVLGVDVFGHNWMILIDLYIFAHHWQIRALRQAIIYKLEQLYEQSKSGPIFDTFEHLAANLPAVSPLVRFTLYCFARHMDFAYDEDKMNQEKDFMRRLPPDFLVEWIFISTRVGRKRSANLRDRCCDTFMEDYNPCLWHEHGDDQKHIEEAHKAQIENWVSDVMDRI